MEEQHEDDESDQDDDVQHVNHARMQFENERSEKMTVDEYVFYSECRKATLSKVVAHKSNAHVCFQIVEGAVEECLTRRYGGLKSPDTAIGPLEYVRGLHGFLNRHNPTLDVMRAWREFVGATAVSIVSHFPRKVVPKDEFLTLFARHVYDSPDCEWSRASLETFSEVLVEQESAYALK